MFQAGEGNIRPSIKDLEIVICRARASEKKNTTVTVVMLCCVVCGVSTCS